MTRVSDERLWPKLRSYRGLPTFDRFMQYVAPIPESGCWLWLGAISNKGYGSFWTGSENAKAHRHAYEHFNGAIPDGLTLDHLCRVRCCVNPLHLEAVSDQLNIRRGVAPAAVNARKTHCVRGHELTKENTRISFDRSRNGWKRTCRICKRERQRARISEVSE